MSNTAPTDPYHSSAGPGATTEGATGLNQPQSRQSWTFILNPEAETVTDDVFSGSDITRAGFNGTSSHQSQHYESAAISDFSRPETTSSEARISPSANSDPPYTITGSSLVVKDKQGFPKSFYIEPRGHEGKRSYFRANTLRAAPFLCDDDPETTNIEEGYGPCLTHGEADHYCDHAVAGCKTKSGQGKLVTSNEPTYFTGVITNKGLRQTGARFPLTQAVRKGTGITPEISTHDTPGESQGPEAEGGRDSFLTVADGYRAVSPNSIFWN